MTGQKWERMVFQGLVFVLGVVAVILCLGPPGSYDVYWHIHMGLDFLDHGKSPYLDHVTIFHQGKPITSVPFLFQMFAGLAHKITGTEYSIGIAKSMVFLAMLGTFVFICWKRKWSYHISGIFLVLFMLMMLNRRFFRPELVSYLIFLWSIVGYLELKDKVDARKLIWLLPMIVIWTNFHNTVILGLVVVAGLLLNWGLILLRENQVKRIFTEVVPLGILTNVLVILRPGFSHPVAGAFGVSDFWKNIIVEFRPYVFAERPMMQNLSFIVPLVLVILYFKRKELGSFLIVSLLMVQSLALAKLYPYLMVVSIPLLAEEIHRNHGFFKDRLGKWFGYSTHGFRALTGFALLMFFVYLGQDYKGIFDGLSQKYYKFLNLKVPVKIADYLVEKNYSGNLVNEYELGGYLGYALRDKIKISIDGRSNILFDEKYFTNHKLMAENPKYLKKGAEIYDFDWVVGSSFKADNMVSSGIRSGHFSIEYLDSMFVLLSKENSKFPHLTDIYENGFCVESKSIDDLEAERSFASQNDLQYAEKILAFLIDYKKAPGKLEFLEAHKSMPSIFENRLGLMMAIENDSVELARNYFQYLHRMPRNLALRLSMYLTKKKLPTDAVAALQKAYLGPTIPESDKAAYYEHILKLNSEFKGLIKESYFNAFDSHFKGQVPEIKSFKSSWLFCNS